MYCYNCGEKLIEGANFCHNCGADQTNVSIGHKEQEEKNYQHDETKIFKMPQKEDDQQLVDYIQEVDATIEKEVEDKDSFQAKDTSQASTSDKSSKDNPPTSKAKKPKRSLKEIWHNFIDEEDNPYSVFSELDTSDDDNSEQTKEKNSLLVTDSQKTARSDTSSLSSSSEISNLTKRVNEILAEQEAEEDQKDREAEKNIDKPDEETIEEEEKKAGLFDSIKQWLPSKSKDKDVNKEKATPVKKAEDTKEKNSDSDLDDNKDNTYTTKTADQPKYQSKKLTATTANEETKEIASKKDLKKTNKIKNFKDKESTANVTSSLKNFINSVNEYYHKLRQYILSYDYLGIGALLLVGLIFTIIPFIQIANGISSALILLIILRIVISYFVFYYANFIASENTGLFLKNKDLLINALINWTIAQIVLFICFQFYPREAAIGFNLLGALTPRLFATLILYVISIILGLASVYNKLNSKNRIDYLGWYSIIFICLELVSKLIWVIVNFISSTLL